MKKDIFRGDLNNYIYSELGLKLEPKSGFVVAGGVIRDLLHDPELGVVKDIDLLFDGRVWTPELFDALLWGLWSRYNWGIPFPGFDNLQVGVQYGNIYTHTLRNWQINTNKRWEKSFNDKVTIQVSYHNQIANIFKMMSETMNGMYYDGEKLTYTCEAPTQASKGEFAILNVDTNFLTPARAQSALDRIKKFKNRGYIFKEDPKALTLLNQLVAGEQGLEPYSIATDIKTKPFRI